MLRPLLLGPLLGSAALLPATVAAQVITLPLGNTSIASPTPTPTPAPFPSPVVTPLPTPTPTPTPGPVPVATPTPLPAFTPTPAPTPRARPGAAAGRPAAAVTRERPTATPTPTPSATPSPTPTATPAPIETVVLPAAPSKAAPLWPWLAGGALLLLALAAILLRRRGEPDELEEVDDEPLAAPGPAPSAPPAGLVIAFRPTRAGVNLLTATVEGEVTVTNVGDVAVAGIRAAVALLAARGTEQADLHAIADAALTRPAVPPFTLQPGAAHRFRAVAALPHASIEPLAVAGRPMFVPLVAVTLRYPADGAERGTTRGFAVGIERVDSAKLAPLWLDVPARAYDAVAARPHGEAIER